MKKCPFCAEEIQDEAIKCRYCGSFVTQAPAGLPHQPGQPGQLAQPGQPAAAASAEPAAPGAAPDAAAAAPAPPFVRAAGQEPDEPGARKLIYEGTPSWRAYLGYYIAAVIAGAVAIAILIALFKAETPLLTKALEVVIPIAAVAVFFVIVNLKRRALKFRVTNTVIETERGLLSKRIDVLQLWRCRDVRFRQGLSDRLLGIAHIEVFAQDATTPYLEITGMPASRQLFEQLRDSIEIQRHAKNVYGVIS